MTQQPTLSANRVDAKARGDHGRPELTLADAHAALIDCDIQLTAGRVRKFLKGYRRCNQGQDFGRYVTDELRRDITYSDRTGEDAVNNVVRGGTR
jgi:hypothetical protein